MKMIESIIHAIIGTSLFALGIQWHLLLFMPLVAAIFLTAIRWATAFNEGGLDGLTEINRRPVATNAWMTGNFYGLTTYIVITLGYGVILDAMASDRNWNLGGEFNNALCVIFGMSLIYFGSLADVTGFFIRTRLMVPDITYKN